ncbi:hypothetical protein [Kocuria rosea]|uniref:hypothetical protein n=1 Tax=Kocuria rosea TaxID=1275 RepID=UPI0020404A88|nr:hypothetical protein [Kocuria rosea]
MTRNNDIETLLRKALENANQDEQDRHDNELGDHQAPRQQSRPIALNDDAALARIVGAALNTNNF